MEEKKLMVKLVSIAKDALSQTNAKGETTLFYPCTIEFKNPQGNLIQTSARVFDKNYQHGMAVGNEYRATARTYADKDGAWQVDIVVSHLQAAARPSLEDLGFAVPTPSTPNFD